MPNRRRLIVSILILLFATLACNEHGLLPLDRAVTVERIDTIQQADTNLIDILWVIDNSNSMCQEQTALTSNFEIFIDGLVSFNADFHMAVVTTDMVTDNGVFNASPGLASADCGGAVPVGCPDITGPVLSRDDYILDPEDPASALDIDALQADFACIATVGTGGSGFEKGLDAMITALSDDLLDSINAGFRRDEAWLAIIFVADENDCSDGGAIDFVSGPECEWQRDDLRPISFFLEQLAQVRGVQDDLGNVVVAGIIGPDTALRVERPDLPNPSCTGTTGDAYAGYRYSDFIEPFAQADRGVDSNICADNSFQETLAEIRDVIRENLAVRCLKTAPRLCEDDSHCDEGLTCENRGNPTVGSGVCSDFEVVVEISEDSQTWIVLEEDVEFTVDYDNPPGCSAGIGIEFTEGNDPPPGTNFRLRYPIVITDQPDLEAAPAESAQ